MKTKFKYFTEEEVKNVIKHYKNQNLIGQNLFFNSEKESKSKLTDFLRLLVWDQNIGSKELVPSVVCKFENGATPDIFTFMIINGINYDYNNFHQSK